MQWFKIDKSATEQPKTGDYTKWKPILAEEGRHQCVYCAIHEAQFGGIRNYHVEHYKPKSLPQFASLENDITNLFYACCICNCFKGNDWPADPDEKHSISSYPDPAKTDYSNILDIESETGELISKYVAGRYLITKLYLNRPQLIMERRIYAILNMFTELRKFYKDAVIQLRKIKTVGSHDMLSKLAIAMSDLEELKDQLRKIPPYIADDIKKS